MGVKYIIYNIMFRRLKLNIKINPIGVHFFETRSQMKELDMFSQVFSQTIKLLRYLLVLYLLPLLFLLGVVVANLTVDIPIHRIFRDPATVAEINPFIGVASNLGVILWSASAAICLFSSAIFKYSQGKRRFSSFLFWGGLITSLLLFDDFFLLHETIDTLDFDVSESVVFIGYAGMIFFWMIAFKGCILKTEYFILLIALVFFGLSLFIDKFQFFIESYIGGGSRIFLEDGFKLLGIVGWFGYFMRCCFVTMKEKDGSYFKC